MAKQPALAEQTLENLDISQLTPISPEVISRQATINIGTIGHVSHGKSTLVRAISGVRTGRYKSEKVRNITIKLGYANAKIYKCACPPPSCYQSFPSNKEDTPICEKCKTPMVLQRHVSFVDCPGHDIFMATMINGVAVMDGAMLLIAANEPCPQPQTKEHLAAIQIMQLESLILLQNKIDLIYSKDSAAEQYGQIKAFTVSTRAENSPIIPISAQLEYNIDYVLQQICENIPVPTRVFDVPPKLIIIRSFDVNKPGEDLETLQGGVVGGSLLEGVLRVGDDIEIRPGIIMSEGNGQLVCQPLRSKIVSLRAEKNPLQYAIPGGLIGVGLKVDPSRTRADNLVGHILGLPDHLPPVYSQLKITFRLLQRLVGVKSETGRSAGRVGKIKKGECLMFNVGSTSTGGRVVKAKGEQAQIDFTKPVCATEGEKIAISRRIDKHWRLIGWGEVIKGYQPLEIIYN